MTDKPIKKCPYCGQEIKAAALKCRYCAEWLEEFIEVEKTQNNKEAIEKARDFIEHTAEPNHSGNNIKKRWIVVGMGIGVIIFVLMLILTFNRQYSETSEYLDEALQNADVDNLNEPIERKVQSEEDNSPVINDEYNKETGEFTSQELGFSVYFPDYPQKNEVPVATDGIEYTIHHFQALDMGAQGFFQYTCSLQEFKEEGLLSDDAIDAYLSGYVENKATAVWENSRIVRQTQILFRNKWRALEYEYQGDYENVTMYAIGIIFSEGGDGWNLSLNYPKHICDYGEAKSRFESLAQSFELK